MIDYVKDISNQNLYTPASPVKPFNISVLFIGTNCFVINLTAS